jgi:hypothetical protein
MTYRAVLRGYLLEEALAWLLRNAGYRLLVSDSDDSEALETAGHTLLVKGRGAVHLVGVLGEFELTPAFSLPVRLFLKATYTRHDRGSSRARTVRSVRHVRSAPIPVAGAGYGAALRLIVAVMRRGRRGPGRVRRRAACPRAEWPVWNAQVRFTVVR